jgi:hypothetical protein
MLTGQGVQRTGRVLRDIVSALDRHHFLVQQEAEISGIKLY